MAKLIEVEVDGASAQFKLREDIAPKSTDALWNSLPINEPVRHSKRSGDACFIHTGDQPFAGLPEEVEYAVSSIYKGWIVAFPGSSQDSSELLISYGLAEYRWPTGRRHVTPLAELVNDGDALFDKLKQTQIEGEKQIQIRQV